MSLKAVQFNRSLGPLRISGDVRAVRGAARGEEVPGLPRAVCCGRGFGAAQRGGRSGEAREGRI